MERERESNDFLISSRCCYIQDRANWNGSLEKNVEKYGDCNICNIYDIRISN